MRLPRIILIADTGVVGRERLPEVIESCLRAGLDGVMLREKRLPAAETFELALKLKDKTASQGALLIINDRVDVAIASGADGVHLPGAGLPVGRVKPMLPAGIIIGKSAHTMDEAAAARREGADYITVAPVFPTASKPCAAPMGVERFENIASNAQIPAYALGGINPSNARQVMKAGAAGVAVISAVLKAPDPAGAVKSLSQSLERNDHDTARSGDKQ